MSKFLNIVSVWNFRSVLMRLRKISIKVFTNILLWLRENIEKILGGFRVYFAKIIFRTPEENFEKVLCNRKDFRAIFKKFLIKLTWKIMKKFLGKLDDSFEKISKICKMSGEVSKNFENITRNFEENFEKTKSKFWRNFLDKECMKSKLTHNSPFAPNRASLSRLPIVAS